MNRKYDLTQKDIGNKTHQNFWSPETFLIEPLLHFYNNIRNLSLFFDFCFCIRVFAEKIRHIGLSHCESNFRDSKLLYLRQKISCGDWYRPKVKSEIHHPQSQKNKRSLTKC